MYLNYNIFSLMIRLQKCVFEFETKEIISFVDGQVLCKCM